ncbi:hypothetical protein K438DRAFT_1771443 [Mycena galopus ATCC 62051]|nr:hypothetical protein K438DRAFT_1771443 [Mycena galopus ATCC 62051]
MKSNLLSDAFCGGGYATQPQVAHGKGNEERFHVRSLNLKVQQKNTARTKPKGSAMIPGSKEARSSKRIQKLLLECDVLRIGTLVRLIRASNILSLAPKKLDNILSAKALKQPPHTTHTTTPKDQVLLLVRRLSIQQFLNNKQTLSTKLLANHDER